MELAWVDFGVESAQQYFIPDLLAANFIVGVIMSGCVFIQTDETTPGGQEFIRTSNTVFAVRVKFRHPNFGIKERTIHLVFPFSL